MTTRSATRTVTFRKPFRLEGIDGEQPPGAYEVATDEETIDNLSFVAWHRVATIIRLRHDGATEDHRVDPVDLEASLLRDAGLTLTPRGEIPSQW